ncbi:hypothetical protein [Microbacterium sp. SLBN-154]|uniref:hypothetical protein n=1 Tax=Microbacterium sp. SLBN-154 TaxID=2768458 RepID=UPI0013576D4C|nr:hypothetical protein [Microbacterium sp. SLBN-154]
MTYAASRIAAQRAEMLASEVRLRQAQARRLETADPDAAARSSSEATRSDGATADCFGLAGPAA